MIEVFAGGPNCMFQEGPITESGMYLFRSKETGEVTIGKVYVDSFVFRAGYIEEDFEDFVKSESDIQWLRIQVIDDKVEEDTRKTEARNKAMADYNTVKDLVGKVFKNKEIIDGKVVECDSIKHLPIPGALVKVRIAIGRDDMAGKIYSEPQVGSRDGHGCWWMMFPPVKDGIIPHAPYHVTDDMVLDFEYCAPLVPNLS